MSTRHPQLQRTWKRLRIPGAVLLVLVLTIDDWKRDFVTHHAEISFKSEDRRLRPFVSDLPRARLVEAVKWSARRIGGLRFVGSADEGADSFVDFVRESRVLPFTEDVRMRIRDRGDDRVVTGESRSRLQIGDLGRNPRNLHRILVELEDVVEGAEP